MTPVNAGVQVARMFIAASAVSMIPLIGPDLPPLADYPNHLARMYLLTGQVELPDFYRVSWSALPNLAMDAIVPLLARIMPLAVAAKLFLAALLLLNASGVILLHRAIWGRWRLWPCLVFLLLYSWIFLWGFVNYLFGQGLAFCAAAAWLAIGPNRPILRASAGAVMGLMVYFCHVEAFIILVLIVLGLEAGALASLRGGERWRALRRRTPAALAAVAPAALLFLTAWVPGALTEMKFSGLDAKLDVALKLFKNYNPVVDLTSMALFFGLFLGLTAARRLAWSAPLFWWLGLLIPLYLLCPSGALTGFNADGRLPMVITMALVAGTVPRPLPRRAAVALTICAALLFLTRMALIERVWLRAARVYAIDISILAHLPPRALLAVASPWEILDDTPIPEIHIPATAVPLRQAFVPSLFAFPRQQPLELTQRARQVMIMAAPNRIFEGLVWNDPVARGEVADVLPRYDYVVFLNRRPFQVPSEPCLVPIAGTPTFQLFKIDARDGRCPSG